MSVTTLWNTRNKTQVIQLLQTHSSDLTNSLLTRTLWNMWFSQKCCTEFVSSGMWHHVVQRLVTNISQDHGASIFKRCYATHYNPSKCQEPLILLHYIISQRPVPQKLPSSLTDRPGTTLIQMSPCLVLSYSYKSNDINNSATKQFGSRSNTSHLCFGCVHTKFWLGQWIFFVYSPVISCIPCHGLPLGLSAYSCILSKSCFTNHHTLCKKIQVTYTSIKQFTSQHWMLWSY